MRVLLVGEPHDVIPDGARARCDGYPAWRFEVAWPWWRRWLSSFGVRAAVLRFDEHGHRWVGLKTR